MSDNFNFILISVRFSAILELYYPGNLYYPGKANQENMEHFGLFFLHKTAALVGSSLKSRYQHLIKSPLCT